MSANLKIEGKLAFLQIDNPPVNGLSHATRLAISTHLFTAQAHQEVKAIVIAGNTKVFSGGADIKEFGSEKAFAEPSLPELIEQVEQMSKPVIAAISGVCMGGGLELAMGCHYRVVLGGTTVAFPEVKLGLLPGAGGTQRLPRLIGIEAALEMITSGRTISIEDFPIGTLFDAIYFDASSFFDEARVFANRVADIRPIPQTKNKPIAALADAAIFEKKRQSSQDKFSRIPAFHLCVDMLEVAMTIPFEKGLELERKTFISLLQSPISKAMRHVFRAEHAATKIEGLPAGTSLRNIASVAVIGAGTMGAGIAMSFANFGIAVKIVEMQSAALEKGLLNIRSQYQNAVKKNKLDNEQCQNRIGLITGTTNYEDIAQADVVIEAVFEDMQVKESVFRELDRVMKPGAILASNTSTLNIDQIAGFTTRPHDVVGLHFFSPANVMELLEIVRGEKTALDVLATCLKLAKRIRKTGVVAGVCDGFIGNRMLEQYTKQAAFLLEEGCTPQQVDQAMEAFGMAMGPFRMSDLAGNDIGWAIRKIRRQRNPQIVYSKLGDLLCERGRFGQKVHAGWYDYVVNDRKAYPSVLVEEMIRQHSNELGVIQRSISNEEIVQRLVFALINEGSKLVAEGIAARTSDIDLVYLKGYGFPLHTGGPMYYAETIGWSEVREAIKCFSQAYRGDTWVLRPYLEASA